MTFAEIPAMARVFIDANISIYHFGGQSRECQLLLERCARQELLGYTSTFVIAEILHRLMIAEAVQAGLVPLKGAVTKLAENPDLVKQLSKYNDSPDQIAGMNLTIVPLMPEIVEASRAIREREGLLTNDSLLLATMLGLGIQDLVSADQVFARVNEIRVYAPQDL